MLRSVLPAELKPTVGGGMAPRRLGTPDNIAKVVAFLASDDGRSHRNSGFVQSPPGHSLGASGLFQVTDIVDPDDVLQARPRFHRSQSLFGGTAGRLGAMRAREPQSPPALEADYTRGLRYRSGGCGLLAGFVSCRDNRVIDLPSTNGCKSASRASASSFVYTPLPFTWRAKDLMCFAFFTGSSIVAFVHS
jgi:hypothetical protein